MRYLSEEIGLIGVLLLFAVYLFIVGRGLYIASLARNTLSRLVAGSLGLTFFVYVLVNAGHGFRRAAGGGGAPAVDQLRWHFGRDAFGRFRHIDVRLWTPEFHKMRQI